MGALWNPAVEQFERFDSLEPASAYADVRTRSRRPAFIDECLITLAAIDDALQECYGSQALYILDDRSVAHVLLASGGRAVGELELRRTHFDLNLAQLVFRFAAAHKFRIADPCTKQLRINSWGRAYCEAELVHSYGARREELRGVVREILEKNSQIYRSLVDVLRRPITAQSALEIAKLNATLQLKLVS